MTRSSSDEVRARLSLLLRDKYTIGRQLGAGGEGWVFQAEQRQPQRNVAIKALYPERAERGATTEAQRLADVAHQNIVTIHEAGTAGQLAYFVMEYVPGGTLAAWSTEPRRLPDRLSVFRDVLAGVGALHDMGVIHRDLKPGNVFIGRRGDTWWAKVGDLGCARALTEHPDDGLWGTFAYAAPERFEGFAGDARSDIYSLGVMLYELLVGRRPYDGRDPDDVAKRHRGAPAPPLPPLLPLDSDRQEALQAVVETAMAKVPAARFASVQAFLGALDEADKPPTRGEKPDAERRRHRVVIGARFFGPEWMQRQAVQLIAPHVVGRPMGDGESVVWVLPPEHPQWLEAAAATILSDLVAVFPSESLAAVVVAGEVRGEGAKAAGPGLLAAANALADVAPGQLYIEPSLTALTTRVTAAPAEASEPVSLATIRGHRSATARPEQPVLPRRDVIGMLDLLWLRARSGRAVFATVTGAPGSGKTTVTRDFVSRLPKDGRGAMTWDSCAGFGTTDLALIRERIRDLAGLQLTDSPAAEEQRLAAFVDPLYSDDEADDAEVVRERLENLLTSRLDTHSELQRLDDTGRHQLIRTLADVLTRRAHANGGWLWVLDDSERIDDDTAMLLTELMRIGGPVLVVAIMPASPQGLSRRLVQLMAATEQTVRVTPFDREDVAQWLQLSPDPRVQQLATDADELFELSGGLPWLLPVLSELATRTADRTTLATRATTSGILRLWAEAVDAQLSELEREVLDVCSVLRRPLSAEALASVLQRDLQPIESALDALVARDVVIRQPSTAGGLTVRLRNQVLEQLRRPAPGRTEADMHRAFVAHLRTLSERGPTWHEQLAHHLEALGDWSAALGQWLMACRQAPGVAREGRTPLSARAEACHRKAEQAGGVPAELRAQLVAEQLAERIRGQRLEGSEATLAEALLDELDKEQPEALRLRLTLSAAYTKASDAGALPHLEQLAAAPDRPSFERRELQLHALGTIVWLDRNLRDLERLRVDTARLEAMLWPPPAVDLRVLAAALRLLAAGQVGLAQLGQHDALPAARRSAEQAVEVLGRSGAARARAQALAQLGEVATVEGALDEASGHQLRAKRLFERARDPDNVALCCHNLGEIAFNSGDLGAARVQLEAAVTGFEATGSSWCLRESLITLALTCFELGEPQAGMAAAKRVRHVEAANDVDRLRADLLIAGNDGATAWPDVLTVAAGLEEATRGSGYAAFFLAFCAHRRALEGPGNASAREAFGVHASQLEGAPPFLTEPLRRWRRAFGT